MASSQLSVTKSDGAFVRPCEPTPSHTLPLSLLDNYCGLGFLVDVFMVYKHGKEPAKIIEQALRKALVPYYPLAGRFVRSEEQGGEVKVACTGDGVWFIKASSDSSLQDLGWLDQPPLVIPKDQLFASHPNTAGMSILMQVTQFKCGGFVVGLTFDHTMADGLGICQILRAIGELSRDLEHPTVTPMWSRETIPVPPLLCPQSAPILPGTPLKMSAFDFPQDRINRLKDEFAAGQQKTGHNYCSTFDVTVAKLWRSRTRAIGLEPGVDVSLQFFASTRQLLGTGVQSGAYYGNCLNSVTVTALSGTIANGAIKEIVALIKDAKKRMLEECSKWANGKFEEDPMGTRGYGYESMGLTDWSQLGFDEVDYGWGGPAYFAPVLPPMELEFPPIGFIIKPPAPEEGRRLITVCVKAEHLQAFIDEMNN